MERNRIVLVLGLVLGAVLALQSPAAAQGRRSAELPIGSLALPGPRVVSAERVPGSAPSLDGVLDEAIWGSAPVAGDFVQRVPDEGARASEPTEVQVAYDDETLYIGARLFDSRPDSIRAVLARRDSDTPADELWVALDSYNDRRTAFVFVVNPSGTKSDWLIYDGNRTDRGWDAVWDVATRVDSAGWTVEMAIPLSQLRFSVEGEGAPADGMVWGANFIRRIARRNEYSQWSLIPQGAPEWVVYYGELRGLELSAAPRQLEVRPYTLARVTRAPGAAGDPFHSPNELGGTIGADIKLGLTSDLTLSATVNPDFGQVEADPSQVNLTANELFLPERRPFFVEGAELFQTGSLSPFYSRRIGRAPQGSAPGEARHSEAPEAVRILGAAKVSGKTADGWSIGLLEAVTGAGESRWVDAAGNRGSTMVEPVTSYAVGRVARDLREGRTMIGAIATATHRGIAAPELRFLRDAAYVAGLDGRHRFGDFNVRASVLASSVHGDTSAIARTQRSSLRYFHRPDADHLDYDPTRTSLGGWGGEATLAKVSGGPWRAGVGAFVRSPGLELNDLGFQFDADIAAQFAWLGYARFEPLGVFRSFTTFLNQRHGWNFASETTGRDLNVWAGFELTNFWEGNLNIGHNLQALEPGALRGGPALLRDDRSYASFQIATPATRRLTASVQVNGSRIPDGNGRMLSVRPALGLRPTPGMELSLEPGISWNRNPSQFITVLTDEAARDHYVLGRLEQTTTSLTARLNYTFSPTLSLELYAQPFVSAGRYTAFLGVREPRAAAFDQRFRALDATYHADEDAFELHPDAAGGGLRFGNPDFIVRELNSNAVLRWEYRPGSALFVVWSQGRTAHGTDGRFDLGREIRGIGDAPGTNVLLVKLSYWFSG